MNPEAYVSNLKGRYFWNKRTADGLKTAVAYFDQAIENDPTYARAYAGLADSYALMGDWQYGVLTPKEALPRAEAAAMAKAYTAEAANYVTAESIQIHGGVGFTWDADPHLFYRRAKANDILLGQQAWQRQRLADLVLAGR